jgi:Protein of unknown function (DUF3040)
MSLRIAQQRALDVMEKALEASEPRLTAKFAIFTRLNADEEPVRAERLPPGRLHQFIPLMIPVAAIIMLIVSLVLGLGASGASACVPTAHAHAVPATGCGIAGRR